MAVQWNILAGAADPSTAFQTGFKTGQEQRQQYETRNAFSTLLKSPNDQNALANLGRHNPELAFKYQEHQSDRADKALDRQIKLSESQAKQFKERVETIGNLAMVSKDAATWDANVDQLVQMGHPEFAQYKGQFSPQMRDSAIAASHQALDWLKANAPQYQTAQGVGVVQLPSLIGQGGVSVNGAPQAPQGQQAPHDPAQLQSWAQEAIAHGADPQAVQQRLQQMMGGAGQQAPRPFP